MHPLALLGEHHHRRSTRDSVLARVHPLTERLALGLQLGEVLIRRAEVVIGRDQVRPGDPHRCFRAALALRIRRHARRDRQPVMAADGHDLRVAHRDPAHLINAHGPLVIGQRVRRRGPKRSQRPIERHHHRRHRLIPQRQHDPKARPRQPRAEQHRRPAANLGPVAIVPLHPQPRLRDPRPIPPPMPLPPAALGLRDRPTRRSLRPQIAHRDQRRVRLIRTDLPVRTLDQLLDLRREPVNHRPRSRRHRQPATSGIPGRHPMRDRLVITPAQLRRSPQRTGQIKRLQNLHDFLCFLQARLLDAPR